MEALGKTLVITGLIVVVCGALLWLGAGKDRGGLLPGDVFVERGNFKFYFPIVTCLVLSVIVTILLRLFHK
jgi:hypothetical protein